MLRIFFTLPVFSLLLFLSCGKDNPIDYGDVTDISYTEHVQKILNEYTGILERNNIFPEGLQMDSWDNLIKGWARGEAVIPFDTTNSLLIELTTKLDYDGKLSDDKFGLLKRWIQAGAKNDAGEVPYEDSTDLLYVCNQAETMISVIDINAKVVIRTIKLLELGLAALPNANPHHIAVEPDGSFWYVSLINESKVLKFNRDNEFIDSAQMPIPALLAAHPTNGLLYVSHFPAVAGGDIPLIGVIDRTTMTVQNDIPVNPAPHAMAVDHSGDWVYTASLSGHQLIPINAATNEAADDFLSLGSSKGPIQLTVSPDDQTLFISAQLSGEMFVVDVSDPNNRTIANTIAVNANPWHPTYTPDGTKVYVGNQGANTISAIIAASGEVLVIGGGSGRDGISRPHGIAVSENSQYIFVSSQNINGAYQPRFDFGDNANIGTVVVVNTVSNQIEKIIEIENFGSGMAINQF